MRTSLILHFDLLPAVDMLSNAEAGKFLKAILHYNVLGVLPDNLGSTSAILFQQIRAQHDRDQKRHQRQADPGGTGKENQPGSPGAAGNPGKAPGGEGAAGVRWPLVCAHFFSLVIN